MVALTSSCTSLSEFTVAYLEVWAGGTGGVVLALCCIGQCDGKVLGRRVYMECVRLHSSLCVTVTGCVYELCAILGVCLPQMLG